MKVSTKIEARVGSADAVPSGLGEEAHELLEQLRSGTVTAADGDQARALTRRLEQVIEEGAVAPVRRVSPEPAKIRPGRQALVDPESDEQLRVEGWTKVRLLTPEQAAGLREAYGVVHGWEGEGFEPDPGNGDVDYRTRCREVLGEVLDPALSQLFIDYSPFLQGYYLKWPGCPETHIHADWTNVDETAGHRSYIAWTALQDITDDVGQMSVLPRSHTVDPSPRGSRLNLPLAGAWEGKEEDVWRRMRRVPLLAGEALVFDMGMIHASFSNTTDIPRAAAVTCLRPNETELVYYRSVSGGTVLRYEVDDDFFVEATPAQLAEELPYRLPTAVLEVATPPDAVCRAEEVLASLEPLQEPPADVLAEQLELRRAAAARSAALESAADAAQPAPTPETQGSSSLRQGLLERIRGRLGRVPTGS